MVILVPEFGLVEIHSRAARCTKYHAFMYGPESTAPKKYDTDNLY